MRSEVERHIDMRTSEPGQTAKAATGSEGAAQARDRIAQTYLGQLGDDETQAIARSRMDWLAEQARGPRVLDIGCSEGILPILLARRGVEVVGVDVNAEALDLGRELLEQEPPAVRRRVEWILGDALELDLPREAFDTVVLGEILEHLEAPAAMLRVVDECLRRGARLLVTTPFGYFPDPDHRQTFVLTDFVGLVHRRFTPVELDVVDGYIRFIGSAAEPAADAWDKIASPDTLLNRTQHAALDLQHRYHDRLARNVALRNQSQKSLAQATANAGQLLANVERWKATAGEIQAKREELLGDVKRWREEARELDRKRAEAGREAAHWRQSVTGLERRARALDEELQAKQSHCAWLTEQSKESRRRADELSRDLRTQVAEMRRVRRELAETYACKRYRVGDLIINAMRSPRTLLRLPVRLWRVFREPRGPGSNLPEVRPARPSERDEVAARNREFERDFNQFTERVEKNDASHLVINFGGTTYIQELRANRPIRLTRSFATMGVPVLFNFHRWRETEHIPPYDDGLVFQSPIDKTPGLLEGLFPRDLGRTRGVFVVSYPHPGVCKLINLANVNGWATLYDCRDDWEEFEKVGMAKWYRPAVEKYVVNNCDMTCCVSRPLQAKLSEFTTTRQVLLSPNAFDPAFVADGYVHRPTEQVKVGYFGHLTPKWFDWEGLCDVMRQRPNYRFEIIGHGAPDKIDLPANARLLGPKVHDEICKIAAQWNVAIIPFRVGRLSDGVDPIKIYEYFGLGLPVVSFRMPQIADYPCTTTVETPRAFAEALDRAVEHPCDPAVFAEFLQHNTWDHRARQMLEWADRILERDVFEKTLRCAAGAPDRP